MAKSDLSEVLERGIENIYPSPAALQKALKNPQKLKFYLGIDPSADFLHLGHTIAVRKLEQLRRLGCKVILLIGNFTATIGDPTDKSAARKSLSLQQAETNAKNYIKLLSPVLGINDKNNPVEVRGNNEWWGKTSLADFLEIAKSTTAQRLLERDMFQERIKAGQPIYAHEFLYPLLQGYDSVAMDVDGEVGGNDQTFNMLMGRGLVKTFLGKEKYVVAMKLLADPSGRKMGKSEGNAVTLNAPAGQMFGVIMSWPDGMVDVAFELLTDLDLGEVKRLSQELSPRDYKARLALEITKIFHGDKAAQAAEQEFNKVFQKHALPEDIKSVAVKSRSLSPVELLVQTGLASSKSEARRIIEQGGLKVDGQAVTSAETSVSVSSGSVVQKGKRHFIRIK